MPPRKSTDDAEAKEPETAAEPQAPKPVLQPFNVVIDGNDRTILAKDDADLQRQIALIRGL